MSSALKCKFCEREAQIVFAPRSHLGRIQRMIKLAEPVCLSDECHGPLGSGRPRRWVRGLPRQRTYTDIMLAFISSKANQTNVPFDTGATWTWYTAKVWQLWLAATGVRGSLRHAPENHSSDSP